MNKYILRIVLFFSIIALVFYQECKASEITKVDILIIGGGASGTAAGIQASRMNAKTLIVEETVWLGGMLTSAGVSAIDGNYNLPAGIWGEFRDSLAAHYGHLDSLKTGWVSNVQFEPSVGNKILQKICANEKNLNIWYKTTFISAENKNGVWNVKLNTEGKIKDIQTSVLIDATELGDVAKHCGVKYDIGMESRGITEESIAPEQANHIIQDLTYVAVLKDYGKNVLIPRPEGYDPAVFACACKNDLCVSPKEPDRLWGKQELITYGKLPNKKYMINWPIEGNDYYLNIIEMSPSERTEALKDAKNFTLCFLYFLQKELGFNTLGLADDEFPTDDRLPFIPYHRESRRIDGKVRFTLNYITEPYNQKLNLYRTNIAVGDYPVDHHHARYHGYENLPNLYFYPIPSYGLPLGTLIPKNVDGLIVAEKSISVSNLVNGTTRLQPVVLQIGQAAGTLAALAMKNKCMVENVSVRDVQKEILASGGYLLPYLDVKKDNSLFPVYQKIGSTGILRGEGRNIGWSNQMWLRADSLLLSSELTGLSDLYKQVSFEHFKNENTISTKDILELISHIIQAEKIETATGKDIYKQAQDLYQKYGLGKLDPAAPIKRGCFAVLINDLLNPFEKEVDIYGNFK